jgi:hypothetical protein
MYNVSSNFLNAVRQPGRVFKSKLTVKKTGYADLSLTDAQIMSIKLSSSSISGEDFEIGTTCAAQLDVEIANLDGSLTTAAFQDAQVLASIGVLLADGVTVEYCPLGVFYVDTPSRTDSSIKLTCYDAIVQLETLYQSTLTYPATLLQVAQDIAGKAGLTLATTTFPNASFSVSTAPNLAGVTLRSALSWVAQASATFARINRDGKLELSFYTSTSTTITAASYFTLTHDDQPRAAITQVTIKRTDDDSGVSSGTVGNTYIITGNPLLANNPSGALTAIYNQLGGFSYMPFQSDWQGNPACMVGDAITITDRANNSYSTIFTECDLVYEGGIKGTAAAKALSATGQSHQTPSAVSSAASTAVQTAQQASFDVAQINNLLAGNITATNIAAGTITADKLAAKTITTASGVIANAAIDTAQIKDAAVVTAKIADAAISTAKIANAAIGTAQITTGAITTALIGTGAVNTAQIADGSITDAKIVGLTANKITAGTIDAANISVINLNCANLTVGSINGSQIASGSITSDNLSSAVNSSILNAANTASAAQTAANGKNRIYRQSTQPSGGTYVAGDTWFDTANGNRASVYNGSAWVLSQFGNAAVANLDAGSITTGTLAAARIGANAITADKLCVGDLGDVIKNPFMDSSNADNFTPNSGFMAATTSGVPAGCPFVNVIQLFSRDTISMNKVMVQGGDQYYIEAYVALGTATSYSVGLGLQVSSQSGSPATNWISAINLAPGNAGTGWTKISGTVTIPSNYNYAQVWLQMGKPSTEYTSTWYLTGLRCRKITPNVLIQDGAITANKISAGSITATQIASGAITGDRLVADSITAREIASASITSNEIAANTITAGNIAAATITAAQIAAGTITGDRIAAGTITADKINVTNLYAQALNPSGNNYVTCGSVSIAMPPSDTVYTGYGLLLMNSTLTNPVATFTYDATTSPLVINCKNGLQLSCIDPGTSHCGTMNASLKINAKGGLTYQGYGGGGGFTVDTNGVFNVSGVSTYSIDCSSQIHMTGSTYPQIYGNGSVLQINLSSESSANGIVIAGGTVRPPGDAQVNLGIPGHRFATVYAASGTINTSDRNDKNSIEQLNLDKSVAFIAALNPVSFKYDDGTSGRTHYGMISQDVEDTMTALGMTSLDFAGFIKSPKRKEEYGTDDDGNPTYTETPIPGEYHYGLRYDEFIAPLIKTVQGLMVKCTELETTIQQMQITPN